MGDFPRIYILILNWNGWRDTIACLESVLRSDYPDFRVVLCDNGSADKSLEHIKSWAEGREEISVAGTSTLRHLFLPPVAKPILWVEYDRGQAESGGSLTDEKVGLILVQTGNNLGFAGGNNVGLRYILARQNFAYVWLLNNDTVVVPQALREMFLRMQQRPQAGICGSTLLYYHSPDNIQTLGGDRYNKWLGVTQHIGLLQPWAQIRDSIRADAIENRLDFVAGASMLVSKAFLHEVGLLSEDYFLYYEEVDWTIRAGKRYRLAYAPRSIVYHKEGGCAGGNSYRSQEKSPTSDYFQIRSRLLVTRKFFPSALPTVCLALLVTICNRIRRRQWRRIGMILRIVYEVLAAQGKQPPNGERTAPYK